MFLRLYLKIKSITNGTACCRPVYKTSTRASSRRDIKAVMCSLMDVSQLLLRQAASLLAEEGVLYWPIRRD